MPAITVEAFAREAFFVGSIDARRNLRGAPLGTRGHHQARDLGRLPILTIPNTSMNQRL